MDKLPHVLFYDIVCLAPKTCIHTPKIPAACLNASHNTLSALPFFVPEMNCLSTMRACHLSHGLTRGHWQHECARMLHCSCITGDMHICQFLWAHSMLTLNDARSSNNLAFRTAVSHGHLNMCQFLKDLGLTLHDVRVNDNEALQKAVTGDHVSILQLLKEWRDLEKEEQKLTLKDLHAVIRKSNKQFFGHKFVSSLHIATKWGRTQAVNFFRDWLVEETRDTFF